MPVSKNIQIIVVALLNVLLAFSCGAVFGAWIAWGTLQTCGLLFSPLAFFWCFLPLLTALVWRLS